MPGLVGQLGSGPMAGRGSGFLMPPPDLEAMLGEALGMMGQMHPRFHPPPGGDQPVPEDAEVSLVGCFAESQLGKTELKYYAESNAASFNAMYWHAHNDHVPYFAMSRHREALGHAFTTHGFVHEGEKPKWGVYDGCGSRCEDDDSRWCGCANEASRGFPNHDCEEGVGEKRFAVYKIKTDDTTLPPSTQDLANGIAANGTSAVGSDAAARVEQPVAPRPQWKLTQDNGEPAIEISVPKGTIARPSGRQVLLYNATTVDSQPEGNANEAQDTGAEARRLDGARVLSKMKLPTDVLTESCKLEASAAADGSQVMRCKLQAGTVRQIPIKVMDEL